MKTNENNYKAPGDKKTQDTKQRMTAHFWSETVQAGRQWGDIFKLLAGKNPAT